MIKISKILLSSYPIIHYPLLIHDSSMFDALNHHFPQLFTLEPSLIGHFTWILPCFIQGGAPVR